MDTDVRGTVQAAEAPPVGRPLRRRRRDVRRRATERLGGVRRAVTGAVAGRVETIVTVALLVVVLSTVAAVTWLSWTGAQEERAAERSPQAAQTRSLDRDLTADERARQERQLETSLERSLGQSPAGRSPQRGAAPVAAEPDEPRSSGGSGTSVTVTLDARLLVVLLGSVALLASAAGCWRLAAWYRRRRLSRLAAEEVSREEPGLDVREPEPEPEPDDPEATGSEPDAEPGGQPVEPEVVVLTEPAVEAGVDRHPDLEVGTETDQPVTDVASAPAGDPAASAVEALLPVADHPTGGMPTRFEIDPQDAVAGERHGVLARSAPDGHSLGPAAATVPAQRDALPLEDVDGQVTRVRVPREPHGEGETIELSPEEAAVRERIFDRRVARRVAYEQQGWLWWGTANAPVTVQDLSATGLRCRLLLTPGVTPLEAPAVGEQLRVFFPASNDTAKVSALVRWRDRVESGVEVGLEFVELTARDEELVRQALLAAT